jgi:hypothetical protein
MGYVVRTQDGELVYPSLYDVERAYAQGLVDPEDDVREEGASTWRKAGTLPALAGARRTSMDASRLTQLLPVLGVVVLGGAALKFLFQDSMSLRLVGIVLTLAASLLLSRLVTHNHRRTLALKAPRPPRSGP